LEASDRRNLSGLDLGQLYELNTRVRFRNFWTLAAAADLAPARYDDREIGDGAALERGRWAGWKLELDSDPRHRVVATLSNQTQLIVDGAYAVNALATLAVHALPQLELELLPQVTWSNGEWRFAWNATQSTDSYLFGKLLARSAGVTLRASYTFTPRLSLQTYAQAFLASGHYTDLRAVGRPAAGIDPRGTLITRAGLATATAGASGEADFEEAALNVNVVLRWEYLLGSTFFLVYTRSQVPAVSMLSGPARLDPSALGTRASADVILFKLSYWWSS
jgi:hypothetical protein